MSSLPLNVCFLLHTFSLCVFFAPTHKPVQQDMINKEARGNETYMRGLKTNSCHSVALKDPNTCRIKSRSMTGVANQHQEPGKGEGRGEPS